MQSRGNLARTDDAAEAGEWLGLGEVAERLNLSVDTVRRRVKDGTFPARKLPSRRGPAWQVRLDPALIETYRPTRTGPAADAGELAAIVAHLQDRAISLAQQVGYLQARLQQTEELLGGQRRSRAAPDSTHMHGPAGPD
jgi:hypothetical protein